MIHVGLRTMTNRKAEIRVEHTGNPAAIRKDLGQTCHHFAALIAGEAGILHLHRDLTGNRIIHLSRLKKASENRTCMPHLRSDGFAVFLHKDLGIVLS